MNIRSIAHYDYTGTILKFATFQ